MSIDQYSEKNFCRKCGTELLSDSEFCHKCGTKVIIPNHNCPYCGHKLLDDAIFCNKCGKRLSEDESKPNSILSRINSFEKAEKKAKPKENKKKQINKANVIASIIFGLVALCIVIACIVNGVSPSENSDTSDKKSSSSDSSTSTNSNTSDDGASDTADDGLTPVSISNGHMLISSSYKGVCPFEVETDEGSNYYIYLDYIGAPDSSTVSREKSTNSSLDESDIAFYVKGGQSVKKNIPIGNYHLYYAVGDTFYGMEDLFGSNTKYYEADDIFSFYATDEYYEGNTVTLYPVLDGNLSTSKISESSFPGK